MPSPSVPFLGLLTEFAGLQGQASVGYELKFTVTIKEAILQGSRGGAHGAMRLMTQAPNTTKTQLGRCPTRRQTTPCRAFSSYIRLPSLR